MIGRVLGMGERRSSCVPEGMRLGRLDEMQVAVNTNDLTS